MRERLRLIVALTTLAAVGASTGAAAASNRAARASRQPATSAAWSPDGKQIGITCLVHALAEPQDRRGRGRDCSDPHCGEFLELVRLSPGGGSAEFAPGPIDPYAFRGFSPDSRQLVFSGASDLMALPLDGSNPVPLAQSGILDASLVPGDAQRVQRSPDGSWVAYVEYGSTYIHKLEVVPTSGAGGPGRWRLATPTATFFFRGRRRPSGSPTIPTPRQRATSS